MIQTDIKFQKECVFKSDIMIEVQGNTHEKSIYHDSNGFETIYMTPIQTEIYKAIEQLSDKATFTEYVLAKKVRENNKIEAKKKAGISLSDLTDVLSLLEEKQIFYSIHINSVNDILLKKEISPVELAAEARKRRLSSEKSMSTLSSGDLKTSGKKQFHQKRSERKNLRISDNFEDFE